MLPPDLAFFGGTFTALSSPQLAACLRSVAAWKAEGLIANLRCSTRPDFLKASVLEKLKASGFTLIELGVQSFFDPALALSRRGYSSGQALQGCALVRKADLDLGIQLMPGMPGLDREAAERDVALAASLAPSCARLYPCLVLAGTPLAAWWRQKKYHPWSLEDSVDFLARALHAFWRRGTPVIRIGLAEEPGLADHVLAGPRHPNIGGMARGKALFLLVQEELTFCQTQERFHGGLRLFVPEKYQGEFWGQQRTLEPLYQALGLPREKVTFWKDTRFALISDRSFAASAGSMRLS